MEKLETEIPQASRVHLLPRSGGLLTIMASAQSDNNPRTNHFLRTGKQDSIMADYMMPLALVNSMPYQSWGRFNDFPKRATALNLENPISFQLMQTKTDFVVGKKIINFYERVDDKGDTLIEDIVFIPEIEDWLEENEMLLQLSRGVFDYMLLGNCYWQSRPNRARNKILRLDHIDPNLIRVGHCKGIDIEDYAFADFSAGFYNNPAYIPKFDRSDPFVSSLMHVKNYVAGSYFYGIPDWIGAEQFVKLLNKIPQFHNSGLERTFFLRWHIQIPQDYFSNQGFTEEEEAEAENALQEHLDNFLAGAENNGKSFITKYALDHQGKPIEGIKIEALRPELADTAFIELYNQGMMAVCSAHGIDPSLASVILNGQFSMGSHMRNSYNIYLNLKTQRFKHENLQPLYHVARANGWLQKYAKPNARLRFGMIGHQVSKLDENADGGKDVTQ